jgi:hypothetical protein
MGKVILVGQLTSSRGRIRRANEEDKEKDKKEKESKLKLIRRKLKNRRLI